MKKQTKQTEQKPKREVWIYLGTDAWTATGEKLFGSLKKRDWKVQCAGCGHVQRLGVFWTSGDSVSATLGMSLCEQCGLSLIDCAVPVKNPTKEFLAEFKKPHSARLIFRINGEDFDRPIFDFYRGEGKEAFHE